MDTLSLYLLCGVLSCAVTAGAVPLLRRTLGRFLLDRPGGLKRHAQAVPCVGGCAVLLGLAVGLIFIRLTTAFPTGTLHSLRGILLGAGLIFILGLADDLRKPQGVSVPVKLAVQAAAAGLLLCYGVRINLFDCAYLSYPLTFLWVTGITNAFNLLDISDGLCVSQAAVCALGLGLIALPSEFIYVNFCACALLGACLGFWPYNHRLRGKVFLGDSGSTLLGFVLAALAMGTGYSEHSNLGFLAPLLILAVPLFDTGFVALVRLAQGKNPLRGSNDHAALRLRKIGGDKRQILWLFIGAGLFFNLLAFALTQVQICVAAAVLLLVAALLLAAGIFLSRIRMKP